MYESTSLSKFLREFKVFRSRGDNLSLKWNKVRGYWIRLPDKHREIFKKHGINMLKIYRNSDLIFHYHIKFEVTCKYGGKKIFDQYASVYSKKQLYTYIKYVLAGEYCHTYKSGLTDLTVSVKILDVRLVDTSLAIKSDFMDRVKAYEVS